jgi:thioredoxin reductase
MASEEMPFVVVGAGPAGLQLAHLLQVKGYSYVVLEKEEKSAAFQARYPVHGRLISLNKRFVGSDNQELKYRQDWNSLIAMDDDPLLFTSYTDQMYPDRDLLRQYMLDWQEKKALNVLNSVAVNHIRRMSDGKFAVTASNGTTYVCNYLFVATGAVGPYAPRSIKGIEMTDGYEDQTSNFENRDYRDKRVLIIGKGNSAFETADFLASQAAVIHLVSRHHIKHAWDTHFVGHLRSVNNNVLDMYQLKAQVGILNAEVESIERVEGGRFGTKYVVSFRFTECPSRDALNARPSCKQPQPACALQTTRLTAWIPGPCAALQTIRTTSLSTTRSFGPQAGGTSSRTCSATRHARSRQQIAP